MASDRSADVTPGPGRDLVGAAAILVGAFLLSRLTGLFRTIAVGYRYGTGPELDAFVAAMRVPDLLFQVVAGGAVAAAFIPVLSGYLVRGDDVSAWRLVNGLLTGAVVLMVPLGALLALFAPAVMGVVAPAFPDPQRQLAAELARIVLVSPTLFALGTLITSVLNARERFMLAALAPSVYNLGIVVGALGLAGPLGIHGLALGAALGAGGYLLVQLPGLARLGFPLRPVLQLADPGLRRVAELMAPRALGLAFAQVNLVVGVALASGIAGAITALDYAWTLAMLPLGLFAMAISTAVFPALADQAARDEEASLARTLAATLRTILYLTIPASVGLAVLAEPIVRLLLERGEFGPTSTAMTVEALRLYAAGLLGLATVEIVARAFYALRDTRTPVAVAGLAMAVNLALAVPLRGALGHGGLALALSLAALVEAALLFILIRRRLGSLDEKVIAASAGRALAGAAGLAVALTPAVVALAPLVEGGGLLGRLLAIVLAVGLGAAVYLAITLLLRSREPAGLLALAQRRIGRRC